MRFFVRLAPLTALVALTAVMAIGCQQQSGPDTSGLKEGQKQVAIAVTGMT